MSNLKNIEAILHMAYKHPKQDVIEEININCKKKRFIQTYKIEQEGNQVDYLLYRFDCDAFPFFNNISGLKQMCDYILFTEWNNKLRIFAIELKQSNEGALPQLEAANEFVNYIIKSANRIGYTIDDQSFSLWKIRICDSKVKKAKIKVSNRIQFDNNNYCDYQLSALRIDQLVRLTK